MAQITVELTLHPKWWLRPALWIGFVALRLGLIRDDDSDEYWGGRITAEERLSRWLAGYAFTVECS